MITVKVKQITTTAVVPKFADSGSNGADLYSIEGLVLQPGEHRAVETGIAIEMPQGTFAFVTPRSGLAAKYGVTIKNSPGLIDSSYRGQVKVLLSNEGKEPFTVTRGDRIAQLVFIQHSPVRLKVVQHLNSSERNEGGFGSTGR